MTSSDASEAPASDGTSRLAGWLRPVLELALLEFAAELLDALTALAQARHVGGIGDAEVGTHAVGRALHGGDMLLFQERGHEVGVVGELASARRGLVDAPRHVGEHVERA